MKPFQALKVLDATMIALLVTKGRLTIDGGTVCSVTLTENPWISLRRVLRSLDRGVSGR